MLELAPRQPPREAEDPLLTELNSKKNRLDIIKLALKRGMSETDAEDIAQEAIIKANMAFKEYRGEAKIKTWLYRIASNCINEFFRKRKRRPTIAELSPNTYENPINQLVDSEPNQEERLAQLEETDLQLNKQAQAILDNLPSDQREIMKLVLQEKTNTEIAKILGVPANTVGTRKFHAIRRLKELLTKNTST